MKILVRSVISLFMVLLTASRGAEARSMASALGYGPEERILIVHADDLGMISAENQASLQLLAGGLVRSGSVMMPCPAVQEVLKVKALKPDLDLGVHFTLNSEWKNYRWGPASAPWSVPSLLDRYGNLFGELFSLYTFAHSGEVEHELRSQIEQAIQGGLEPSHLDVHMAVVFMKESWLRSYLRLAHEYHLAPMIPRWNSDLKARFGFAGRLLQYSPLARLSERIEKSGFLLLDQLYFEVAGHTYSERKNAYLQILRELKPGVSQIILHASDLDEEYSDKILKSDPKQKIRNLDARIFQDPEIQEMISAQKLRLISWKDIQAVYPWKGLTGLD